MDRFQRCLVFLASSPAILRRALLVGCAVFLVTWHFLPRSPVGRVVTVSLAPSTPQPAGHDGGVGESSVRRFIVPVDSPQLKQLEELATGSHKTKPSRMPLEYYAEQWRITAAQYYYERDLQRESFAVAADGAKPDPSSRDTHRMRTSKGAAIAPVSFEADSEMPPDSASFGSSYWQLESRQAKARQRALLASLPAPDSLERPTIVLGELTRARPVPFWVGAAATAAVLSALGAWWLQRITRPPVTRSDCRPMMQLALPGDWIQQAPSLGQRLVSTIVTTAWLSILGGIAVVWLKS